MSLYLGTQSTLLSRSACANVEGSLHVRFVIPLPESWCTSYWGRPLVQNPCQSDASGEQALRTSTSPTASKAEQVTAISTAISMHNNCFLGCFCKVWATIMHTFGVQGQSPDLQAELRRHPGPLVPILRSYVLLLDLLHLLLVPATELSVQEVSPRELQGATLGRPPKGFYDEAPQCFELIPQELFHHQQEINCPVVCSGKMS